MSLETGLDFELLLKHTAVSKRHYKGYFYLDFFVGKEIMCWIRCCILGTWYNSSTVVFTVEEFCQHRKKNLAHDC